MMTASRRQCARKPAPALILFLEWVKLEELDIQVFYRFFVLFVFLLYYMHKIQNDVLPLVKGDVQVYIFILGL